MSAIYNSSVFVPNGRGQVSLDCFRLYEAIFAGCIPVIVSTQQEFKKTFSYNGEYPPFLVFPSWREAATKCAKILSDSNKLNEIQRANLIWLRKKIARVRNLIYHKLIGELAN